MSNIMVVFLFDVSCFFKALCLILQILVFIWQLSMIIVREKTYSLSLDNVNLIYKFKCYRIVLMFTCMTGRPQIEFIVCSISGINFSKIVKSKYCAFQHVLQSGDICYIRKKTTLYMLNDCFAIGIYNILDIFMKRWTR